jgi:uncharacterized protein involved in exopolysaccharide biosynthesis
MQRERFSRPHRSGAAMPSRREWTFTAKDVLIILGLALGLSGLMGLGATMLVEMISRLFHSL